ncbi:MAG: heme-binding domain-containing protein [Bacteroidota bacterium]
MKKSIVFLVTTGVLFLVFQSFIVNSAPALPIPEDVQGVLKNSCYDCHSNEASNKKAQFVLNFNKWEEFKASKKISRLEDICALVEEGKMPPEKYVNNKPDRALSDSQKALICDWTKKESATLMEGN